MIRVLIKANSSALQERLEGMIRGSRSLELIDSADSAPRDGIEDQSHPDVVIAQIDDRHDEILQEAVDWAATGTTLILLTQDPSEEWKLEELHAGVKAILPTNVSEAELLGAIEAAAAGLIVIHPADLESFLPRRQAASAETRETLVEPLTPREIEVLRRLAEGLGNKEIASELGISEHTAKFHVASLMGKLGASSRTEAVTQGIRRGLVII